MTYDPSLLPEKQKALSAILQSANLNLSILFGSAAHRQPFHDLDVGVIGVTSLNHLLELGADLERAAGLPVDLVDLEKAPTALQFEASKGVTLTTKDPEVLAAWKERVWNEYFAQAPFLEDYAREMFQARAMNFPVVGEKSSQ